MLLFEHPTSASAARQIRLMPGMMRGRAPAKAAFTPTTPPNPLARPFPRSAIPLVKKATVCDSVPGAV